MTVSEKVKIVKAAGVVGLATLGSRIMGYVRDMVMSWAFGTGLAADAFYVAYRIPNLLRELLAEGSMSAAFIPVFTETLTNESRESAHGLANAVFSKLVIILFVLTGLGILFAPFVVKIVAWGWAYKTEHDKYVLGVTLTRIMFPYLFFIGLTALAMGMLNSLRAFFLPALSPVVLNIMTISAAVLSVRFIAEPIMGVAVGIVLGGLCQFLIQVPGLKRQNMMVRFRLDSAHAGVNRIGRLVLPVFLSSSVNQFNILIGTVFASFLTTGSISYLFYGMRFIHFPLGIFGIAVATAVLPSMATQAARREIEEFRETLSLGLRLVFFIMFPAMAGIITLHVPIISLLLEHGQFDRLSTQGTAAALLYYGVGLWAFGGVRIVVQAFYALQDTKTPVVIAIITILFNILLSFIFVTWTSLAHGGLALAVSLAATLNICLLTWQLRKKIGRMDGSRIVKSLVKIIPASIGMGIFCRWISMNPVWDRAGNTFVKAQLLGGGIAVSIGFYILAMWILKSEELKFVWEVVRRKR